MLHLHPTSYSQQKPELDSAAPQDWVLLDEINLAPQEGLKFPGLRKFSKAFKISHLASYLWRSLEATLEGLNALLDHRREAFWNRGCNRGCCRFLMLAAL